MKSLALAVAALAGAAAPASIERRLADVQAGTPQQEIYLPAETIGGGSGYRRLPRRDNRAIDPAAIERAAAYAASHGAGVLMIWHKGGIVAERGIADGDPETLYDSFSMHKTLVALLVGAAIADGAIASADAPASIWLTEWRDDARSRIRIIDLLRMQAGIERQRLGLTPPFNLETRMLFGDDIWGPALARGVSTPPATEFHYNNVETQLLGIIIERATGRRYGDYLAQKLWRPLGAGEAKLWLDRPGGKPRVYCCMLSRAEDWIRVGRLFLNAGRVDGRPIVEAEWVRAAATASPLNPGYGYQLWLAADPARLSSAGTGSPTTSSEAIVARDTVFLAGFAGQRTYVIPSCEMVIVRMGPKSGAWDQAALPNILLRGLKDRRCWQRAARR